MEPAAALARFEAMLARDSLDAVAGWRAALSRSDLAIPLTGPGERARRDSLLAAGERDARRAVRLAPASAPALFALGLVLGNEALTRGIRDRVRMAVEIRSLALRALAADSMHDGAHHLLGRWHYEVRRLSGLQRFLAKTILGGRMFGEASWEEARRHLERAVAIDPARIYHRLDLARVALATRDTAAAVRELRRVAALPDRVLADRGYRREAAALLESIAPAP
jgi:tetratricopeptide (TPR) repeat protein